MVYTPGNAMVRANFATLMKKVPEIYELIYKEIKRRPAIYSQICDVGTMDRQTITLNVIGGLGDWTSGTEGDEFAYSPFAQGTEVSIVATKYKKAFDITWEMQEDNQWSGVMQDASEMGVGAYNIVEQAVANLYNNSFTSGAGADGAHLCDPDGHNLINSSDTGYNTETVSLSPTGLSEMRQMAWDVTDEAGIRMLVDPDTIIVPTELETLTEEILKSTLKSGTDKNDINVFSKKYKIIVNPFLTSATAYWLIDSTSRALPKFLWRNKPVFKTKIEQFSDNALVQGKMRFGTGYNAWQGVFGSLGTA